MITCTIDQTEHTAPSVEELRTAGFRVYVRHRRRKRTAWHTSPVPNLRFRTTELDPRGGQTRVILLAPDGRWSEGIARCCPADPFIKRVGYILACERAIIDGFKWTVNTFALRWSKMGDMAP